MDLFFGMLFICNVNYIKMKTCNMAVKYLESNMIQHNIIRCPIIWVPDMCLLPIALAIFEGLNSRFLEKNFKCEQNTINSEVRKSRNAYWYLYEVSNKFICWKEISDFAIFFVIIYTLPVVVVVISIEERTWWI